MDSIYREVNLMDTTVKTAYGMLEGTEGCDAVIFKGVPYAEPPGGDRRWKAPERLDGWEGSYRANAWPPMAPQSEQEPGGFYQKEFYAVPEYMPEQSEDCLYLNIWVPREGEGPFPVAVWYHGGAYVGGFCSEMAFDGEAYAKRGVILVTVGYRLGLLGFLAHPALHERDGRSGNYGMLDQIAAIDWVQENIAAFGGNPDLITIMGQSAGAMSVRTLISSPLMQGKVQRAIIQSGGGYKSPLPVNTMPMETLENAVAAAMEAQGLTLAELYKKSAPEIIAMQMVLWQSVAAATGQMLPFCPQVDGYCLTKTCDQALEDGEQLHIPYLIGSNQQDLSKEARPLDQQPLHMSNVAFCEIQPDNSDTYVYLFKRQIPGDDMGAFHSAELWYMFGTLERCWRPLTEADAVLSEEMLDAWTLFAKTGNPGWEPYRRDKPMVKMFDISPEICASQLGISVPDIVENTKR